MASWSRSMKAPNGSYFITGRPRSRTAWLTALFYGEIPCYHDEVHRLAQFINQSRAFGFASPSLLAVSPETALHVFEDCPKVIIIRDKDESRRALMRWAGVDCLPNWAVIEDNFLSYCKNVGSRNVMIAWAQELDVYETVNAIHQHCLGRALCEDRFRVFSLLKIEQHLEKARKNTPAGFSEG